MAMTYERLSQDEIEQMLQQTPGWEMSENSIKRQFEFEDFDQAMDFVNNVADLARQMDHHPDICIRYSKVELTLSTHKAGGLTQRDFTLAGQIDGLLDEEQCPMSTDW